MIAVAPRRCSHLHDAILPDDHAPVAGLRLAGAPVAERWLPEAAAQVVLGGCGVGIGVSVQHLLLIVHYVAVRREREREREGELRMPFFILLLIEKNREIKNKIEVKNHISIFSNI